MPAPRATAAAARRRDRLQLDVRQALVAQLVLLQQQPRVEAQRLGVGAQERLDVRWARQQVPFLVLERTQVLRADLRRGLDLRDVDAGAHPRLSEGGPDRRHESRTRLSGPTGYAGVCPTSSGSPGTETSSGASSLSPRSLRFESTRGRSASVTSTWRGLEPS